MGCAHRVGRQGADSVRSSSAVNFEDRDRARSQPPSAAMAIRLSCPGKSPRRNFLYFFHSLGCAVKPNTDVAVTPAGFFG